MKVIDIISEEQNAPDDFAENVVVDWNKLRANLTVIATDDRLKGVRPVDAIMYLGAIGSPDADLTVRQRPARFGQITPKALAAIPSWTNIGGEYVSNNWREGYGFMNKYDVMLNPKYFDRALGGDTPELVAHELRHRGFDIIWAVPQLRSKIPKHLEKLWNQHWHEYRRPGEPEDVSAHFEHLLMMSLERSFSDSIGTWKERSYYRSKEEVLQFRRWYYEIEAAIKDTVVRMPVPPGGYEALRKEVDAKTPSSVDIKVTPNPGGKPIITGTQPGPKPPVKPSTPIPPSTQKNNTKADFIKRFG